MEELLSSHVSRSTWNFNTRTRTHTHAHAHTHVIPLLANIHSLYRHTEAYTPSLGFVADSTSVLKISILYFSLCHPEKHWLFSKNNLSSFLSQSSSPPPHFSLYLRDFNVAFLRSKRVHSMPQPLLRPTLKYKIVIHTILLIIYIPFWGRACPLFVFNYCHSKNIPTISNQAVYWVQILSMFLSPIPS